jgi:hypothetical protein
VAESSAAGGCPAGRAQRLSDQRDRLVGKPLVGEGSRPVGNNGTESHAKEEPTEQALGVKARIPNTAERLDRPESTRDLLQPERRAGRRCSTYRAPGSAFHRRVAACITAFCREIASGREFPRTNGLRHRRADQALSVTSRSVVPHGPILCSGGLGLGQRACQIILDIKPVGRGDER